MEQKLYCDTNNSTNPSTPAYNFEDYALGYGHRHIIIIIITIIIIILSSSHSKNHRVLRTGSISSHGEDRTTNVCTATLMS